MQCKSCGTTLPMGISNCPTCGAPTPYVRNSTVRGGNTAHSDSTVASTSAFGAENHPPTNNNFNLGTQHVDPYSTSQKDFNEQAPQNPYTQHTYDEPDQSYNEPAPANPYEQPDNRYDNLYLGGTGTSNPYENTVQAPPPPPPGMRASTPEPYKPQPFPIMPPPQHMPQPQQQSYQPAQRPFQAQAPQAVYRAPQQVRQTPPPAPMPQRSSNAGKIAIFVLILLLVGVGIIFAMKNKGGALGSNTTNVNAPSGSQVDQNASSIITNPRLVANQKPASPERANFKVGETIYGMFNPNLNGQSGFVMGKWYSDKNLIFTTEIQRLNPNFHYQFFSSVYSSPTTAGSVEFYYCTKIDCSDAQLAAVKNFTVTADGNSSDTQNNSDNLNPNSYPSQPLDHKNKK